MSKRLVLVLLAFSLFLVLLAVNVNAGSYYEESYYQPTRNYEKWAYTEDLHGKNQGFVLTHTWSSPSYRYEYEERNYDIYPDTVRWRRYGDYRDRDYYGTSDYGLRYAFDSYRSRPRYYSGYGGYYGNYRGYGYYSPNYW